MTVSTCQPDKAPSPGKHINFAEPLVESVRTFLANEVPSKQLALIPRSAPASLDTPESCDVEIGSSTLHEEAIKGIDFQSHLKRNDLNNNSNRQPSSSTATAMPNQAERMQRQPLLARAKMDAPPAAEDSDPDRPTDFTIEIPPAAAREDRFPKEIWKTLLSFLFLFGCVCVNMLSLSLVHERLPDRNTTRPLNDIFLDNVKARDWGLSASEVIIMLSTSIATAVVVFHKHRFIVARRLFFIIGLLYLYRSVTMFVTVLPVSSTTYYCSPKTNSTAPLLVLRRMFYLISGFGLSINGKHTYCGDYIYSGHTMVLVLSYMVIAEYSPRKLWPVHWAAWCAALLGVGFVLLAHGHYTVDVVIAYYITTRLFWTFHALLNAPARHQMIAREWWFPIITYLERNTRGPVPRRYDWPLPWPRTKLFSRLS